MKKLIVLLTTISIALFGCAYRGEFVRMPDAALYHETLVFNNVQYVPLLRFCNYYELDWDWDLVSQRIEIKRGGKTVTLMPDSSRALVNEKAIRLDHPVEYKDGTAYIPAQSALFLSEKVFGLEKARVVPVKGMYQIKTVVIDPGHGGKNWGARSRCGTKEKNIVLDISKRLKRYLEKKGLKVFLTRNKDVFIPLKKRTAFANNKKADLFISVHANASRYSSARGLEVFYLSEATDDTARALAAAENASLKFEEVSSPTEYDLMLSEYRRESRELACYICNVTADRLGMRKRGVKGARFVVLKGAMMPAVLAEVGFLTNWQEASKLKKSSFRDKVASAISCSILAYKREYERTDGFSR